MNHADAALEYLDRIWRGEGRGISFGWGPEVDAATMGLEPEGLVVLGACNKAGKTSLAVNTVGSAIENDLRVQVVTTEISATQYLLRLACRSLSLSRRRVLEGELNLEQRMLLECWVDNFRYKPFHILDRPLCTYEEIQDEVLKNEPELLIIDHLQRLQPLHENEALSVKRLSLKFKNLALSQKIPILLLSQVTTDRDWFELDSKTGDIHYRPSLISTRWGKEPVGEADKFLVFHNLYKEFNLPRYRNQGNLILHSMRDYASGDVLPLTLDLEKQRVGDYKDGASGAGGVRGATGTELATLEIDAQPQLPDRLPDGTSGDGLPERNGKVGSQGGGQPGGLRLVGNWGRRPGVHDPVQVLEEGGLSELPEGPGSDA